MLMSVEFFNTSPRNGPIFNASLPLTTLSVMPCTSRVCTTSGLKRRVTHAGTGTEAQNRVTGMRRRRASLLMALLISECLNGIDARSLSRRINAENHAHRNRNTKSNSNRCRRDDRVPLRGARDQPRKEVSERNPNQPAADRNQNRFKKELPYDVAAARADRTPNADLARPFEHRRQHDFHDH